jgi:hypothetical protein
MMIVLALESLAIASVRFETKKLPIQYSISILKIKGMVIVCTLK